MASKKKSKEKSLKEKVKKDLVYKSDSVQSEFSSNESINKLEENKKNSLLNIFNNRNTSELNNLKGKLCVFECIILCRILLCSIEYT